MVISGPVPAALEVSVVEVSEEVEASVVVEVEALEGVVQVGVGKK